MKTIGKRTCPVCGTLFPDDSESCPVCALRAASFSSAKWEAITRHMREEPDLSPEEQEAILEFLKSDN